MTSRNKTEGHYGGKLTHCTPDVRLKSNTKKKGHVDRRIGEGEEMKIIKAKDKVKGAIESFLTNYPQYGTPNAPFYTRERYNKVVALDPDKATPEDIKRDINSSWVMSYCSECGGEFDTVIEVGQEPDYESNTAWLCKGCAYDAFDMIAKAECE